MLEAHVRKQTADRRPSAAFTLNKAKVLYYTFGNSIPKNDSNSTL